MGPKIVKNKELNKLTTTKRQPKKNVLRYLSLTERLLTIVLSFIFVFSGILLLKQITTPYTSVVPTVGGTFSETIEGFPQFINPVLASSDTDKDLVKLIFSGLMRRNLQGDYEPDLADEYSISDDGKTYTFHINPQAKFHDGQPVTADDVIFTIEKTQSPLLDSPRLANWQDVKVTKKDDQTIVFSLKKPYQPFISQLTLGILPAHLWQNISNEQFRQQALNRRPVGSGPFAFVSHDTNSQEQLSHYTLKSFPAYLHGQPFISTLDLNFVDNIKPSDISKLNGAYAGVRPQDITKIGSDKKVIEAEMDRVFAIFFNPGEKSALKDTEVRQALALLIDRKAIIKNVLAGHGREVTQAFPIESNEEKDESKEPTEEKTSDKSADSDKTEEKVSTESVLAEKIKKLLEKADWEYDEDTNTWKNGKKTLSITLKIPQIPAIEQTAKLVAATWNEVGIKTDIKSFPADNFNKDVLNTRDYEAIIFGQIIDKHTDLKALWHSSRRNAPGLNIAGYTNTTADKLLEKINQETDPEKLKKEYAEFNKLIAEDVPAIFLYSPNFIYLVPEDIKSIKLGRIKLRNDRYNTIQNWYIKNDRVWNFLLKNNK